MTGFIQASSFDLTNITDNRFFKGFRIYALDIRESILE